MVQENIKIRKKGGVNFYGSYSDAFYNLVVVPTVIERGEKYQLVVVFGLADVCVR